MDTEMTAGEMNEVIQKRFAELPRTLRQAITSADIQKGLRSLAELHQLHLDQWQILENEVVLTLLGLQEAEALGDNLEKDLGISENIAHALAADVSRTVFEPIRAELERTLEHPDAKSEGESDVDALRTQMLAETSPASSSSLPPIVKPATPPPQPPTQKAERGPASGAYVPGEVSSARKSIVDDPYREAPR